jgi:hypothetical protein
VHQPDYLLVIEEMTTMQTEKDYGSGAAMKSLHQLILASKSSSVVREKPVEVLKPI